MRAAAINVGAAIIEGLTAGVIGAAGDLYAKISGVMDHAMSLIHKIPGYRFSVESYNTGRRMDYSRV